MTKRLVRCYSWAAARRASFLSQGFQLVGTLHSPSEKRWNLLHCKNGTDLNICVDIEHEISFIERNGKIVDSYLPYERISDMCKP